jgi:hypothetical protein
MHGGKADTRNNQKPQPEPDEVGTAIHIQVVPDETILPCIRLCPFSSQNHGPPGTGTLWINEIAAQGPFPPSRFWPRSLHCYAATCDPGPASGLSVTPMFRKWSSACAGKSDREQGKVENLGTSTTMTTTTVSGPQSSPFYTVSLPSVFRH